MASNECNSTLDCLNVGSGVPRVCYEAVSFSDREFFCDCSNWYGWTGEACDEPSFLTFYSLTSLSLLTIWTVILMYLSGRTLYFHLKYTAFGRGKGLNPAFYTGLLVFIGALCFVIYTLINISALADSSRYTVNVYRSIAGNIEDVSAKGGRIGTYSFLLMGNIYLLLSSQIVISWYNVIGKVSNFLPGMYRFSPKTIKSGIKIWMALYSAIMLGLLAAGVVIGANVVLVLVTFMMLFLYTVAGSHFVKSLKLMNANSRSEEAIEIVISSCRINRIIIVSEGFLVTLQTTLLIVTAQAIEPGSFNTVVVLRDLVAVLILTALTINSWYVHNITKNVLRLDKSHGWLPGTLVLNRERTRSTATNSKGYSTSQGGQAVIPSKVGQN